MTSFIEESPLQSDDLIHQGFSRQASRTTLLNLFGEDVLKQLSQRSNIWGSWALLSCWGAIALAMAAIVWAQSLHIQYAVPVVLIALMVIAGRQLGLSILMHEASHRALFKNAWMNDNSSRLVMWPPYFCRGGKIP